jgi:hypothetical protein
MMSVIEDLDVNALLTITSTVSTSNSTAVIVTAADTVGDVGSDICELKNSGWLKKRATKKSSNFDFYYVNITTGKSSIERPGDYASSEDEKCSPKAVDSNNLIKVVTLRDILCVIISM